jgi:probable HAF family extracellular repeat protein
MVIVRVFTGLLSLAVIGAVHGQVAPRFFGLGELGGPTGVSRARAVSADGYFAVGMASSPSGDQAVRREVLGALAGLSDLPGGSFASEAHACSMDGAVVFGSGTNSAGNREAFRWTAAAGMSPLGFLPSGGYSSIAYGCSADGSAACGENLYQGPPNPVPPLPVTQAFLWTAGGMQGLGFLPGASFYSSARAMSNDGSVVVGIAWDAGNTSRPFRWTAGTGMVDFTGGTVQGTARGTSATGEFIVGSNSQGSQAFLWSQTTGVMNLGVGAGFVSSAAADVSADGQRVVGVNNDGAGVIACIWQQGIGWRTVQEALSQAGLQTSGWGLTSALTISDNGMVIAGLGLNPQGVQEGWIAVLPHAPPPCPSADFNNDGDVGTDGDIEAFFACLGGNCCLFCGSADFNGDGDVGTDADIETFFHVLGSSC